MRLLNEIALISFDVLCASFSPIVKASYLEIANLLGEMCAFSQDAHSKRALCAFIDICGADATRRSTTDLVRNADPISSLLSRESMKLHLLKTLWEMSESNGTTSGIEDVPIPQNAQQLFLRPDTTVSTTLSVMEEMDDLASTSDLHVAILYGRLLCDSAALLAHEADCPHTLLEPSIIQIIDRCSLARPSTAMHLQTALATASPDTPSSLSSKLWTASSPEALETALRVWPHRITGQRLLAGTWTDSLPVELQRWNTAVRCAIQEDNDFPLRQNAAQSLHALTHIWSLHPLIPSRLLVDLVFTLHDIMTDDDDDIRDTGASVAHTLLSFLSTKSPGSPDTSRIPVPPVACSSLRNFLVKSPHTRSVHPYIAREALRRLADAPSPISSQLTENADVKFPDMASQLHELDRLNEHTPLFAMEKQNLYFDPVRDQCDAWSVVLKRLLVQQSPARGPSEPPQISPPPLSPQTLQTFTTHTQNSLTALTRHAESTEPLASGALGWSSGKDGFVLGMRVVYCADVVLNGSSFVGGGGRHGKEGGLLKKARTGVRRALVEFLRVGKQRDVHPLWLEGAERVLVCAVRRGVGRVGIAVDGVEEGVTGR